MLNVGFCEAFCVNILMHVFGFHSRMPFILRLFPLPPSPDCCLPSRQLLCSLWLRKDSAIFLGKASTQVFLDCSEVNGSRPAGYSCSRSAVGKSRLLLYWFVSP